MTETDEDFRLPLVGRPKSLSDFGCGSIARLTILSLALSVSACGFVHDETLVGRYKLVAVDIEKDMVLCWGLDNGSCDGLVGPTVFEAGFNDKYVVAARHPSESNKLIVEYYYVVRDSRMEHFDDGSFKLIVKGPFDTGQFSAEKSKLHLPEFELVFSEL